MSTHAIARVLPRAPAPFTFGQTLGGLLIGTAAAGATAFVSSRSTVSGLAVLVLIAGSVWFVTTRRTSLALALLMLYLGTLDGYLKLRTGSNLVTFARDALLYAIVVGLLVRAAVQGTRVSLPPLSGWVIAFVVLVLVQIANPQAGSLYHSLAGVRQNLEFVPLFFLTFMFVRTAKALRSFVVLLAVVAAANGAVSYAQFRITPQQLASWGPGYAQRILGQGQFAFAGRTFYATTGQELNRPFGLMSDAGGGGLVGALSLGGILALASMRNRRRYFALAAIAAVAAVVGIATSQARSAVVGGVVIVLAYALLTVTSRRAVGMLLGIAALAAVAYVGVSIVTANSQSAIFRYKGVSTSQIVHTTAQARGASIALIPQNIVHHPLGAGLGVAGPAAGVSGAPALAGVADAENEFSFATLESGVGGMLALVGFTVLLFVLGLKRCRHEPDPEARVLLAGVVAPIGGMLALYWVGPLTPTTPYGPYLWAAGGIVSYWLIARPGARINPCPEQ